jgi:hypothetical protein
MIFGSLQLPILIFVLLPVLTVMSMKLAVFWGVVPCNLVDIE